MTREELLRHRGELERAYPTVIHAITFVEAFINGEIWNDIVASRFYPHQALVACQELVQIPANDQCIERVRLLAQEEMQRPEFLTYIKGKLGATW